VTWRADADDVIVGSWSVAPQRPEVRLEIDGRGAVRRASALRWGTVQGKTHGYIPCCAVVHAERRFGDLVIPSDVTVAWWFGTSREAPFFEARILDATPAY
jgi:Family of unknown function (DUF6920)